MDAFLLLLLLFFSAAFRRKDVMRADLKSALIFTSFEL